VENIVYWSVDLQTAIPLEYISFVSEKCKNYTIKYFVETKNDVLPISSLAVDDIFGDVALLVHPQDKRYKKLIGKRAIIPIVNRPIPIIGDARVDISKDNGIKRVNPTSDFESIALAKEYNLPLDHYVFDKKGAYTQYAGEYYGKPRKEFYANILQFLQDITNLGTIYEEERLIPYSKLSGERLVPFLISELVLDVHSFKDDFLKEVSQSPFSKMNVEKFSFLFDTPYFVLSRDTVFGFALPLFHSSASYLSLIEFFANFSYSDADQECFDHVLWYFSLEGFLPNVLDSKKLTSLFAYTAEPLFFVLSILERLYPHFSKSISKLTALIASKNMEQLKKYCEKCLKASSIVSSNGEGFSLHLECNGDVYEVL
jgi:valyl-tRNA synthetase